MIPFGPKPVPPERWFESKPLWQRVIILLAGVTMNVVLAVVVSIGLVMTFGRGHIPPVIGTVAEASPAARAGFAAGDSIVSVDTTPTRTWSQIVDIVSASPNREVAIGVVRAGERREIRVTPDTATAQDLVTGNPIVVGRIGVLPVERVVRERLPVGQSVKAGLTQTWVMGTSVIRVVKGLFAGEIAVSNLGGPVTIIRASVGAARTGTENLFALIAFLSINLAVLNLIPIPLLDGGQIVLQTAETVKGSPFSDRTREWIARVGLAAIVLLFVVVTFNDLKALVRSVLS
jgi:regulator of sigma E protease